MGTTIKSGRPAAITASARGFVGLCSIQLSYGRSEGPGVPGDEQERKGVKLTAGKVVEMRSRRAAGEKVVDLARAYGVTSSMVAQVCTGATWAHVGGPRTRAYRRGSLAERIAGSVDASGHDGCHLWTGRLSHEGYGVLDFGGRTVQAHRAALELHLGRELGPDEVARHADGCPRHCVNPRHLQPGTIADNNRDTIERGRHARGERGGAAKLTEADVLAIRALPAPVNCEAVGRQYGVTGKAIAYILDGQRWAHLPCPTGARRRYQRSISAEVAAESTAELVAGMGVGR